MCLLARLQAAINGHQTAFLHVVYVLSLYWAVSSPSRYFCEGISCVDQTVRPVENDMRRGGWVL